MALVIMFNMLMVVEVRHFVNARRGPTHSAARTYPDIGHAVFGRTGKLSIEAVLVALELGICTVYFEFLATNLGVITGWTATSQHRIIMLCLYPFLTSLTQIRYVKELAPLSGFANVCMLTVSPPFPLPSAYHFLCFVGHYHDC
jgi:hypothetical protein